MKYMTSPLLLKGSSHMLPVMHATQYPGAYFLSNSCCQTTGKYISSFHHLREPSAGSNFLSFLTVLSSGNLSDIDHNKKHLCHFWSWSVPFLVNISGLKPVTVGLGIAAVVPVCTTRPAPEPPSLLCLYNASLG